MSGRLNIRVQGIDKILKSMSKMPAEIQTNVRGELKSAADEMVEEASRRAPADEGALRNAVSVRHGDDRHEVFMQKNYGVFQEFGTGKKFKAPAFLGSYPSRFRGATGGSFKEGLDSLTGWVKRKGIGKKGKERSVAYLILRKILREGLEPRPFFFNSFLIVRERLVARLKRIIKEQVRK
jgi:HK97 gp10 family phage protein